MYIEVKIFILHIRNLIGREFKVLPSFKKFKAAGTGICKVVK